MMMIFMFQGHTDTVTGMQLSPDGAHVLTNAMDNTLRVWVRLLALLEKSYMCLAKIRIENPCKKICTLPKAERQFKQFFFQFGPILYGAGDHFWPAISCKIKSLQHLPLSSYDY